MKLELKTIVNIVCAAGAAAIAIVQAINNDNRRVKSKDSN